MPEFCGRTHGIQKAPIQELLMEAKIPEDVISLGQGVPFFGPPEEAISAASDALNEGYGYTEDIGTFGLRKAIAKKLLRQNHIHADPERNIMVTAGGNQAFINALMAITNIGDDVVILSPYYFNHFMAIKLVGCNPIVVETDENYLPQIEEIFEAVTPHTKAIVTISPNNPTGAVYSKHVLEEINKFCSDMNIYHISDEVYEQFVFKGIHQSPASFDKNIEHTISIFSFSKSFGMPGYRIGYLVLPSFLYNEILKVQDTIGICAPTISQYAAEAVLNSCPSYAKSFLPAMEKVRNIFIEGMDMECINMPVTHGSFYFFIKLHTNKPSWEIAKVLIEKYGVITIPGNVFGSSYPSIRISYGNLDEEQAEEGVKRLAKGLKKILK